MLRALDHDRPVLVNKPVQDGPPAAVAGAANAADSWSRSYCSSSREDIATFCYQTYLGLHDAEGMAVHKPAS